MSGGNRGHDIASIDVEPTGYTIRCACGWRGEAEHRDEVSVLWWRHVLDSESVTTEPD